MLCMVHLQSLFTKITYKLPKMSLSSITIVKHTGQEAVNCVKFSFFDRFCSQNDVNNVCKVLQVPQTPYRGFAPGPTRDSVPPDSLGYSSPNDNSWRRHYLHFQRPKILSHDLPIFHQRSHPLLTFVEVCSVQSWTTSRDRRKMRSSARQSLWHE